MLKNRAITGKRELGWRLVSLNNRPKRADNTPEWLDTRNFYCFPVRPIKKKFLTFFSFTKFSEYHLTLNGSSATHKYRENKTPTIQDFITTLTLNFHSKLPLATSALFYNIGETSIYLRLKPRLSQDILHL